VVYVGGVTPLFFDVISTISKATRFMAPSEKETNLGKRDRRIFALSSGF
jgi:hypothetical protein